MVHERADSLVVGDSVGLDAHVLHEVADQCFVVGDDGVDDEAESGVPGCPLRLICDEIENVAVESHGFLDSGLVGFEVVEVFDLVFEGYMRDQGDLLHAQVHLLLDHQELLFQLIGAAETEGLLDRRSLGRPAILELGDWVESLDLLGCVDGILGRILLEKLVDGSQGVVSQFEDVCMGEQLFFLKFPTLGLLLQVDFDGLFR